MVSQRTYIITIGIALLAIGVLFWYYSSKEDKSIDLAKYVLRTEMERQMLERDSINEAQRGEITDLKNENTKAIQESQYWYKKAQERIKSPNYDFDFITASSIITESNYRPNE